MTRQPCWMAIQHNFFSQNLLNNKVYFPAERQIIVLVIQHGRRDVTCKLSIRCHNFGRKAGAVVRALASHKCGLGSIPRLGVMWRLSLLVLYSAPRCFSPGIPVFPSPQKPTFYLNRPFCRYSGWFQVAIMGCPGGRYI